MSAKSHQINLYDPADENKFYIENEAAGVSFKDEKADRKWKFYVDDLELYDAGVAPGPALAVKAKFAAGDAERTANAAAAVAASGAAAAEQVRAMAGEAGNLGLIQAEVARAGVAEAAIQADVDANEIAANTAQLILQNNINAQKVSYEADDLTEKNRALAAEQALQTQISNILSDATPQVLDDLASIVTAFQSADNTLTGALATLQTSFDELKDRVDALTEE